MIPSKCASSSTGNLLELSIRQKGVAADAFESRKSEFEGDDKAGRMFSLLELPMPLTLRKVLTSNLDQTDIRDTLSPSSAYQVRYRWKNPEPTKRLPQTRGRSWLVCGFANDR